MRSISDFLANRVVLLTGGTGFLGKALMEKALRAAPDLRRLYVVVRPGRKPDGSPLAPAERLRREIFDTAIFARLRQEHGEDFWSFLDQKVVAIAGDLRREDLGISAADRARLGSEVDTIIHSAASVHFDERIDHAVEMNTMGPRRLVELARTFDKRTLFAFVSTCYVSGIRTGVIPEDPPQPGKSAGQLAGRSDTLDLDVDREIREIQAFTRAAHERADGSALAERFRADAEKLVATADEGTTIGDLVARARKEWLTAQLVAEGMRRARRLGWHEVYTFTKAMGEAQVIEHRGDLPVALIRPSIIESSLAEPEPGWINGLKVADPLIAGYAKGRIPDFPGNLDAKLDLIPVDFVANAILAAVERLDRKPGLEVYHVATGARNPVRLREVFALMQAYYRRHPMRDKRGEPIRARDWKFPNASWFRFRYRYLTQLPLHLASRFIKSTPVVPWPAGLGDGLARGAEAVGRLLYYIDIYGPYTNLDSTYASANTQRLFDELSDGDKVAFNFDVESISWPVYLQDIHLSGLDRHVLRFGRPAGTAERHSGVGARHSTEDLRTIPDLLRISAERFGDKVALQIRRDSEWVRLTYRELYERAGAMGARFRARGLSHGQRVVLIADNQPDWAVAYMALHAAGATVVPIDIHTPAREIEEIVEFTTASAVIASVATYGSLPKSLTSGALPIWNLNDAGMPFGERGTVPAEPPPGPVVWAELSPDDIASIIFTSGPAVEPRGAMLTHRNFIANLLALSEVLRSYETDRFVSVLPLHHALEFTGGLLMPLFSGALVTYATSLKSNVVLATMRETGATALLAVPRIFEMLLDRLRRSSQRATDERNEELDAFVNQTRLLVSGGAPLDISIYEGFAEFGFPIHEGYGLTETAPILTVNPLWAVRPRSVGKPLPGVELIIDQPDESGEGEIVVRGPNVMKGYFGNPATTARTLRDGWLYTGDLGRVDSDGYVMITGRSKELIVTGAGKNVWPEEVELFYRDLNHIEQIAVFGVREVGATRETVHAAIYAPGGDRDTVLEAVHRVAHERPSYQRIQHVHFWDKPLPRLADTPERFDRKALRDATLTPLATSRRAKRAATAETRELKWWERDTLTLMTRIAVREPEESLSPRESLTQLYDSVQLLELVATLEDRFSIHITDDQAASMRTVGDVLKAIEAVAGDKAEPPPGEFDEPIESDYWKKALVAAGSAAPDGPPAATGPIMAAARAVFQFAAAAVLKGLFRLDVRGADKLPRTGTYLLAANHSSHLDTFAILAACRGRVRRLQVLGARDYFFDTPLKAWFFRNFLNVVPFDREKNFVEGMRACQRALRPGEPVLIFPEGTRSLSGRLQPFKLGLGILALELQADVVPVRIRGSYEAMPKGSNLPRPHRIEVAFGEPVDVSSLAETRATVNSYSLYREIVSRVRQQIERLLEEG